MEKIIAYIDGGSRNNPGPAACGVFIETFNKQIGKYLGQATNNEAEYQGAILALKKIKSLIGKEKSKNTEIEIRTDSELLYKQITHQYKVKNKNLLPLFVELWNLCLDFKKVEFKYIPREKNKIADKIVNNELDKQESKLF